MLKHGILGLLNYGAMTGYEIRETFQNSLNFFWKAQSSQIYRELQTLKKNGWIEMERVEQTGKPDKNVCHITADGKTEFLRWLGENGNCFDMKNQILMRVFFFGERTREENIAYFERLIRECQGYIDSFEATKGIIDSYERQLAETDQTENQADSKALYWQMTVSFGYRNLQGYIDWARDCIEMLQNMGREEQKGL